MHAVSAGGTRLGVDVGGTFTDLIAFADGGWTATKVPSTPGDQSEGVIASIRAAGVRQAGAFAHGMTVATNALLERKGARVALVTTEGFRDLVEIARQARPSLYEPHVSPPAPLVARDLRFTVRERMGPEGVVRPLEEASVDEVVEALRREDVESVAVCLLFGFLHPAHERRVGEILRAVLPGVHVSLSCDVLPEMREYERLATTAADAYLAPRLASYLRRLDERAREAGLPAPWVMQSSGGVVDLDTAARHAAACVLSGPAGGVVGAGYAASASGYADVLTLDMGGTSTDVAAIVGGRAQVTTESVVAGIPLRLPMVDVHTVSAGGGSIAWADSGGALRVGPASAGAVPGPASYGRGGTEPTVTDADLFLGYLGDGTRLGGEVELSRELAEEALERVARPLGLTALETAMGIVRVANAEMLRALRVISVERGVDPRQFALVAFGGAGGLHACALAEESGMRTVLVPKAAGVLSALGLAISDVRRDYARPMLRLLEEDAGTGDLRAALEELAADAAGELGDPRTEWFADLRHRGQSFELTVPAGDLAGLRDAFHDEHERRYGYRMPEEPVELVALRVVATVPVERPPLREEPAPASGRAPGSRSVFLDGGWREAPVWSRADLGPGSELSGPGIVELPEATCLVAAGWDGRVDGAGTLILERAS
jgi:N-methylhydantoinase A